MFWFSAVLGIVTLLWFLGVVLCREWVTSSRKGKTIMGDKSPKAVHKQAAQKQIKANAANQRKQQDVAAMQPAIKMK